MKTNLNYKCAFFIYKFRFFILPALILLSLFYLLIFNKKHHQRSFHQLGPCARRSTIQKNAFKIESSQRTRVNLAAAVCGDRVNEAMIMLKSAVVFAKDVDLFVEIFQDDVSAPLLPDKLEELKNIAVEYGVSFGYRLHDSWFPQGHENQWRNLYAPCSAQRLFFPLLLPDVDSLVYVDTDILFLSSLKDIWDHFGAMDEDQVFGMAFDDEPTVPNGYFSALEIPFYDRGGLNAGVTMMNLTRLRKMEFQNEVQLIMDGYEKIITGDQDVINIYLHYHPCHVYEITCAFNYGFEHCRCHYGGDCRCKTADTSGISILHGRAHTFYSTNVIDRTLFTIDVYDEFLKVDMSKLSIQNFIKNLQTKFSSDSYKGCFKLDSQHRMLDKTKKYIDFHFHD